MEASFLCGQVRFLLREQPPSRFLKSPVDSAFDFLMLASFSWKVFYVIFSFSIPSKPPPLRVAVFQRSIGSKATFAESTDFRFSFLTDLLPFVGFVLCLPFLNPVSPPAKDIIPCFGRASPLPPALGSPPWSLDYAFLLLLLYPLSPPTDSRASRIPSAGRSTVELPALWMAKISVPFALKKVYFLLLANRFVLQVLLSIFFSSIGFFFFLLFFSSLPFLDDNILSARSVPDVFHLFFPFLFSNSTRGFAPKIFLSSDPLVVLTPLPGSTIPQATLFLLEPLEG